MQNYILRIRSVPAASPAEEVSAAGDVQVGAARVRGAHGAAVAVQPGEHPRRSEVGVGVGGRSPDNCTGFKRASEVHDKWSRLDRRQGALHTRTCLNDSELFRRLGESETLAGSVQTALSFLFSFLVSAETVGGGD